MAETLSVKRVSLSLAYVTGIVSIVCALLLAVARDATLQLFGSIFHGIDVSQITTDLTWGSTILGVVVAVVLAAIIGALYAKIYNAVK